MTLLDPGLVQAYRETDYLTDGTPGGPVLLKPDQVSPSLDRLFSARGIAAADRTAAFITAFNPFSISLPDAMNEARHRDLRAVLDAGGWTCFEGSGVGEAPVEWTPEKSFLVLGIGRRKAMDIGILFQQNAIVFAESGHPAELVLLR